MSIQLGDVKGGKGEDRDGDNRDGDDRDGDDREERDGATNAKVPRLAKGENTTRNHRRPPVANGARLVNGDSNARNETNRKRAEVPPENNSAYATLMNSGEENPNGNHKDEEGTVVARKAMSSANGADSMSAVSKAGRESHQEAAAAVRDSINQAKPTESLSSAAAGVFPGSYAAAMATAASLVSQNTGRAAVMNPNKSLSSEIPIDTNEALNALTNHLPSQPSPGYCPPVGAAMGGATGATGSQNQAHAKSPRFADGRPSVGLSGAGGVGGVAGFGGVGSVAMAMSQHGGTVVPGRPSRMGQLHAQNQQMQNSSNSGNHKQRFSAQIPPKNKSFSSASRKHPMRPPPNTAAAAIARMNVALPTGSSSRQPINIQLDQFAHTDAEDAVSTVQPEAGEFLQVVCDAVSKASGEADDEAHCGGDKEDVGYTESRAMGIEDGAAMPPEDSGSRRVTRSMAKRQKK